MVPKLSQPHFPHPDDNFLVTFLFWTAVLQQIHCCVILPTTFQMRKGQSTEVTFSRSPISGRARIPSRGGRIQSPRSFHHNGASAAPATQAHLGLLRFYNIWVSRSRVSCLRKVPSDMGEEGKSPTPGLIKEDKPDSFHLVFYTARLCQVKSGSEVVPTAEYQMLAS